MSLFRRTRVLKINPDKPQKEAIELAAEVIKSGGLVAFPTETVYGLGADCSNKKAVKRVYSVKNRPSGKPLTLHIADINMLEEFISEVPNLAQRLINKFWPGPLTVVMMSKKGKKLGFRMPNNRIALDLIKECAAPIVAPSANPSGGQPPKDAEEVRRALGRKIDMIIDGGNTSIGRESTVIDCTVFPCRVLREGAISKTRISEAWYSR